MKRKAILGFWTWETSWCCNETSPKTWVYRICINNKLPKQSTTTKIKAKTFFFHFCWTTFFFIFHTNPLNLKPTHHFKSIQKLNHFIKNQTLTLISTLYHWEVEDPTDPYQPNNQNSKSHKPNSLIKNLARNFNKYYPQSNIKEK